MGGSTWKENGDGTYTQLDRDYYSPAKGWSWLALYLMGLAKPDEVQPFFILRNLQRTGQPDANGHPIFKGDKTIITIEDVIAAMGPRVPDFDHAQKKFNTAIVVMTMPGKTADEGADLGREQHQRPLDPVLVEDDRRTIDDDGDAEVKLYTYLNYGGNCRQAFEFYAEHLGGKITMITTHGEQPGADKVHPSGRTPCCTRGSRLAIRSCSAPTFRPIDSSRCGARISR